MGIAIEPHGWGAFPGECLVYFLFLGVVHVMMFAIGSIVLVTAFALREPHTTVLRRVRRFGLFVLLLLLVGSLVNGLWSCLVWGRLYYSTDYVVDFTPV